MMLSSAFYIKEVLLKFISNLLARIIIHFYFFIILFCIKVRLKMRHIIHTSLYIFKVFNIRYACEG